MNILPPAWREFQDAVLRHPLCRFTILPAGLLLAAWGTAALLVLAMWSYGGREAYGFGEVLEEMHPVHFRLTIVIGAGLVAWGLTGQWRATLTGLIPLALSLGNDLHDLEHFNPGRESRLLLLAAGILAMAWLLFLDWRDRGTLPKLAPKLRWLAVGAVVLLVLAGLVPLGLGFDQQILRKTLWLGLPAVFSATLFLVFAWRLAATRTGRLLYDGFAILVILVSLICFPDSQAKYHSRFFLEMQLPFYLALSSIFCRFGEPLVSDFGSEESARTPCPQGHFRTKALAMAALALGMLILVTVALGAWKVWATQRLFTACARGTPQQIDNAIVPWVNINVKNGHRQMPLMVAVSSNPDPQAILDLVKAGAKTDTGLYAPTLLTMAVYGRKKPEILTALIQTGADVNHKERYSQWTPLMYAASSGQPASVKVLIEAGADVNAKDKEGMTVLLLAVPKADMETIRLLVEAGADVNARTEDSYGRTVLLLAVANPRGLNLAEYLIQAGAEINGRDKLGKTPLIHAASDRRRSSRKTVQSLIRLGADVNARDNAGRTPLMYAVGTPNLETIKFLIQAGADVNARDNDGQSVLKYNLPNPDPKIAKFLVAAGAK